MAQKTAWTGSSVTESDINTYLMHEGGAWTTYVPTLSQSVTVTKTVTYASYARASRMIIGTARLAVTGTGTAANVVVIGLPVAAAASVSGCIGSGFITDTSAGPVIYTGTVILNTTTTVTIVGSGGVVNSLGVTQFAAALANTDIVSIQFCYEAAT